MIQFRHTSEDVRDFQQGFRLAFLGLSDKVAANTDEFKILLSGMVTGANWAMSQLNPQQRQPTIPYDAIVTALNEAAVELAADRIGKPVKVVQLMVNEKGAAKVVDEKVVKPRAAATDQKQAAAKEKALDVPEYEALNKLRKECDLAAMIAIDLAQMGVKALVNYTDQFSPKEILAAIHRACLVSSVVHLTPEQGRAELNEDDFTAVLELIKQYVERKFGNHETTDDQ